MDSQERNDRVGQLRKLIVGDDLERLRNLEAELEQVRANIENKEQLIATLDPVIAGLLERKIRDSGDEMAEVLAPLMGPAIKKQVEESKDEMVEALYPVIGRTVRRAVAEAMRHLARQVNERLDRAFRFKSIWLRIKAKLLGLPEAEVRIAQAMPFGVEQLYLIDQKTGLLIQHESLDEQSPASGKPQMISGMLTAIEDFIKDSFSGEDEGEMHEVKIGGKLIFIVSLPPAYLAAVTEGVAPVNFSEKLQQLLSRIHTTYLKELRVFDGDSNALSAVSRPLRQFIRAYAKPQQATAGPEASAGLDLKSNLVTYAGVAAILALLAFAIWSWLKPAPEPAAPLAQIAAPAAVVAPGPGTFRVEARFIDQVWVRVVTDEHDSTDFMFQRGEVYAWRVKGQIQMRVGNAGDTELFLNGRNLGMLGDPDEPVTLRITADGIVGRDRPGGNQSAERVREHE